MANLKHMKLLRETITKWDQWRQKYPEIQPDLTGANLCFAHLNGTNLSRANLTSAELHQAHLNGANLRGANLRGADFTNANLTSADLTGADLSSANLSFTYLTDANLSNANLNKADLRGAKLFNTHLTNANLTNASLIGVNLFNAYLTSANLSDVDLSCADLTRAHLVHANLSNANLTNANLTNANLTNAHLYHTNLNHTYLHYTNLSNANLSNANLSSADLTGASLNNADLSNADLSSANLTGAHLYHTIFAKVDLRSIKGLIEIYHGGPSFVELYSIQLPQDGSALHFLRGVGAPDEWIDFYRATMMQPIQYYSCFLSYSSDDTNIAKRLHADLQANGVRCWFAPHELKPGDYFRQEIDKAIQMQDKLLLILSEHSVSSKWVKYEVNRALDREIEQERAILFPIRIDNTVLHNISDWAHAIRSSRHIGDFTGWDNHTTYQDAFVQLLKHLKAETKL